MQEKMERLTVDCGLMIIFPLWLMICCVLTAAVGVTLLRAGATTVVIDGFLIWTCLRTCPTATLNKINEIYRSYQSNQTRNNLLGDVASSIPWGNAWMTGCGGVGVGGGVGIFCTSKM